MEKTVNKYFNILAQCDLFSGMTASETVSAIRKMNGEVKNYKKGEFVHKPGEAMSRFGLVLSGCIEVCSDDIEGDRMIMADVNEGKTFGESLCFLETENTEIYAYALYDAKVLWLSAKPIFIGENRDLQKRFSVLLAKRTLSQNSRIQVLSKTTLRGKLITYFTNMCKETGGKIFTVPYGREDMAVYMGVNRSALSRELSKMKNEEIIDYHKSTFKILK